MSKKKNWSFTFDYDSETKEVNVECKGLDYKNSLDE